ncbi:MAG: hypothetical protein SGPRY_013570, partial [Prymnesium sp.]
SAAPPQPSEPQEGAAPPTKVSGTVKWFNSQKGFGFIIPSTGADDIFVHQTDIVASGYRSLQEGEEVEFEVSNDKGKLRAVNVTGPDGAGVSCSARQWPKGTPPSEGKRIGTVKWFNVSKGFGFIQPEDGSADIFVHTSDVTAESGWGTLRDGEQIEFSVVDDQGKPRAVSVSGPNGSSVQGASSRHAMDMDQYGLGERGP